MTPELVDLARRAFSCKHFRWVPGMRTLGDWRIINVDSDGIEVVTDLNEVILFHSKDFPHINSSHLNLTDPATLGCLLSLVRETWSDLKIHAAPAIYSHESPPEYQYTISHWHVYSPGPYDSTKGLKCDVVGKTEAEALVKALEAAP